VSEDTPKDLNLNTYRIEAALAKALPGVKFERGYGVNTAIWQGDVWEFHIEVSLRSRKISFADDKPGTGHFLIQRCWKGAVHDIPCSRPLVTLQDLEKQLVWFRGFLLGISEVVNRACTEPPPEPQADIFRDV
jgi:hypothetical protein